MTNAIKSLFLSVLALASVACAEAPVVESAGSQSATLASTSGTAASVSAHPSRESDGTARAHRRVTPLEIKAACHTLALLSTDCDTTESVDSCGERLAGFEAACRDAGVMPTVPVAGMSEDQAVDASAACRSEAVWPEQIAPGVWVAVCGTEDGLAQYAIR